MKQLIHSPIINELCYDFITGITTEDRKKFPNSVLNNIATPYKAKRFVNTSSLDEKLLLLTRLGVQFSFIIHNKNPFNTKEIKARYEKYKGMAHDQLASEMAQEKVVVLSDRILINFLNVMSRLSHTDTYLLNMDFHRVGKAMVQWQDRIDMQGEAIEYARLINRLVLNAAIALKTVKHYHLAAEIDQIILMHLYEKQGQYVPRETIYRIFSLFRRTAITAGIKRLFDRVFIERNPEETNQYEYQITSLGKESIMEFHTKILSKAI